MRSLVSYISFLSIVFCCCCCLRYHICNAISVNILHFDVPVQEGQESLMLTHSQPLPHDACFSDEFSLHSVSNHVRNQLMDWIMTEMFDFFGKNIPLILTLI